MLDLPDEGIIPLSMEHVFWTWSAQAAVKPIAVKSAKGVHFWDIEGKRYLDFNSMTMCVISVMAIRGDRCHRSSRHGDCPIRHRQLTKQRRAWPASLLPKSRRAAS